jgi:carboxylate-amine ligase
MLNDHFHASSSPTLGVELELQIVDASTLALQDGVDGILAELPEELHRSVTREFHTCCVEISTEICSDIDAVRRDLKAKLRRVAGASARRGQLLAWGGTHPFSHWKDQVVTSEPRYRALAESYQEPLLRQLTFGLHIHVGVPSGDVATVVCDRIRDRLPILLALSANSPFWCGRATGLHSHRLEVTSGFPTCGLPPCLGSWESYLALVKHLTDCGLIESAHDLWWDVRPSALYGTVEVRICDMPLGLEMVLGLTALVQCLVHALAHDRFDSSEADDCAHGHDDRAHDLVLEQNRWLASRYGLDAPLVDCRTKRKTIARVLARELIDQMIPIGRELGCAEALRNLRARTWGPTGAVTQITTYSRTGSLEEIVRVMTRADSSGHWHPSLSSRIDQMSFLNSLEANL